MKKPPWLEDRLTEMAHDILNDNNTIIDGSAELTGDIFKADKTLAMEIVDDRVRGWIKTSMHAIVRAVTKIVADEQQSGQGAMMPLPFPWLNAYLEVGPGRTVHQRVMTAPDWDRCKAIWANRRDQAELGYKGLERAYDLIRPLLHDEFTMTGDVVDKLDKDYNDEDPGEAVGGVR